jgi:hypothetical protein
MKTRGITRRSGRSSAGLSKQQGSESGDPYRKICDHLHALLSRKRGYYGCKEDGPLDNAMGVAEDGVEPWRYQLARIGEKRRRLNGPAGEETLTIVETLFDIMGHAAVGIACLSLETNRKRKIK